MIYVLCCFFSLPSSYWVVPAHCKVFAAYRCREVKAYCFWSLSQVTLFLLLPNPTPIGLCSVGINSHPLESSLWWILIMFHAQAKPQLKCDGVFCSMSVKGVPVHCSSKRSLSVSLSRFKFFRLWGREKHLVCSELFSLFYKIIRVPCCLPPWVGLAWGGSFSTVVEMT